MGALVAALDAVNREVMFFAAVGILLGGLDDLVVDLIWLVRRLGGRGRPVLLGDLPLADPPLRLAVFVPAWDEVAVIGPMLRTALSRYDHPDYRILVGLYPNDRATLAAVEEVAAEDGRVRAVVGPVPGPTTKAGNLNALWDALRTADAGEGRRTDAVVFHDAEDAVHPAELRVIDALVRCHDAVQLPVRPLVKRGARLVSGHYADEFAESHCKGLVVRGAIGAGMPLAGVGCAISTGALEALAADRGGRPFASDSLVEDYELGLDLSQLGRTAVFARVAERRGGPLVATNAYFPWSLKAAVRQKARWMTGIALAGWDRTRWASARGQGWARLRDWPATLADHWMRARDRRAPIALIVLAAAYLSLLLWGLTAAAHWLTGIAAPALGPVLEQLLLANAGLLAWRMAARAAFTWRVHGLGEAAWSVPRLVVANYVSLLAVRRAIWTYAAMLRGRGVAWDKTAHHFPGVAGA